MDLNKNKKLYQLLTALERSLLSPEIRSSKAEIDKLLSDDFLEFGASGRVFNKNDILNNLPKEEPYLIHSSNFKLRELSPDIILVTYTTRSQAHDEKLRHSLRSSIWKHGNSEWKMVFHQGTITPTKD